MSFLNFLCLSFFLGIIVPLVFSVSTSLNVWLISLFVLVASIFSARFITRDGQLVKALVVLFVYFLGFGWISLFDLVSRLNFNFDFLSFLAPIGKSIEELRLGVSQILKSSLGQRPGALALGMIFGSRQAQFDHVFIEQLRRTGVVHMVAVSGYNVSIIINILLNTSFLVMSRAFIVLGILILLIYTLVVGFSASVLRAVVMGLYLFVARLFGRQGNLWDALLFSAALLLFFNPRFLLDLGFQLSFLAMLGIIFLSPFFERVFRRLPHELPQIIGATLSSQIMILPVALFNFGQISLVAPLTNLLTFWTVPAIMTLTAAQAALYFLSPWLALPFAWANLTLLNYFIGVVELLSRLPWASLTF